MSHSFDRVARAYRWCEYLALGRTLERVRFHHLPSLMHCNRALILGEGDGRFLARLLRENSGVTALVVDSSEAMLRLARARVRRLGNRALERVTFVHQDIRAFQPDGQFDLIVTHFVLDCLTTEEVRKLVGTLREHMQPGATWCHSDFALPRNRVLRLPAAAYIRALYAAFALLTGLRVDRLPEDERVFREAGFVRFAAKYFLGGLLKTELFRRGHRTNSH